MVAKAQGLTWRVEGGRNKADYYAHMLARAAYGHKHDWSGFVGSLAMDFYTQDNGAFVQCVRDGDPLTGRLVDIGHIDSRCCNLTGNSEAPMVYSSEVTGQVNEEFRPGEFIHFASMPMPQEQYFGAGYCAVSRAIRAAKLLMGLHDYDAEKLSNLPPEGVATVTGLTPDELSEAFELWKKARERDSSVTYPQVLWLVGSQPNSQVDVRFVGFSQIPESFDRQTVVQQYVNTLALCFGVDTREFWAISSGALGTASETEIQHLKAKGKGAGEFLVILERALNAELPDNVLFRFDTRDIEEDMVAANTAKAWIQAYSPLLTEVSAINSEQLLRLLVDKGVLPEWIMTDSRLSISSSEVHEVHKKDMLEDLVCYAWKQGVLQERISITKLVYIPPSVGYKQSDDAQLVNAIYGKPIPETEVDRGAKVTRSAVVNELRRWRSIPELEPHIADVTAVELEKRD